MSLKKDFLLQTADTQARFFNGLDYTALNGVNREYVYDGGTQGYRISQDVRPILDEAARKRNEFDRMRSAGLTDTGIMPMYDVPIVVLEEIKSIYNIDYNKDEDLPRLFKILERDYAATKTTTLNHAHPR